MKRTIKEATVKRFLYDDNRQFETHLADFVAAYNFARRLKTLRGLTPYGFTCKPARPSPIGSDSIQSTNAGLNT